MKEKKTVFIVDDEPAVANALSRLLRASGYATQVFGSAREFMDLYKSGAGSCLVLDVTMPEMTGLDLQQWLLSKGDPLPIIFVTALEDGPQKVQAIKQGAVCVLMKPVTESALLRRVEEALARDRKGRDQ